MPGSRGAYLLTAVLALAAVVLSAQGIAADRNPAARPGAHAPPPEFRAAKRAFQQKFRSRQATDRVEAVRKLDDVSGPDAAELIWQFALGDDSPEVRLAGVELLAGWRDQDDVWKALLERTARATRKSGIDPKACSVLRALGGTENGDLQEAILGYLNEFLETPQGNQRLVHTLVDELGRQANADALRTLTLFSHAGLFRKNFGFRRCVLQGIVKVPGNDTITYLIDLLPELKGLVQQDVILHLIRVTGQNFRDDAAGWKAWWVRQNMQLPDEIETPSGPPGAGGAYYGIPIGARRVVFVLDISGSMEMRGKFDAARRELSDAIKELPNGVQFDLVLFHAKVHVWQPELVPANDRARRQAVQHVMNQTTRGGTASFDALEAAFALDPEAIYFVSDGEPRGGKLADPDAIVAAISEINHLRRVSVHAVGLGTNDPDAPRLAKFMRGLADRNWGEYRAVDQ